MSADEISHIIAHEMDLEQATPRYANTIIQGAPDKVLSFFEKHIVNSINAVQTKTCRFRRERVEVLTSCIEVVESPKDEQLYITTTIELTRKLFDAMKNSTSKSSGTLIFMKYRHQEHNELYLVIMKMDPNDGIQYDRTNSTFRIQEAMLPETKNRLHKCAFIKLRENLWDEEFHLYVLDKQQKTDSGPSKFFVGNYLEAELLVNNKETTELISKKLPTFANVGLCTKERDWIFSKRLIKCYLLVPK